MAKAAFKTFKKSVEKEIRKARTEHLNNQVLNGLDKGNTNPFFKYIKSLKNDSIG